MTIPLTGWTSRAVKQTGIPQQGIITTGVMAFNLKTQTVEVGGTLIDPPRSYYERKILELLNLLKGMTVTDEMFLDHLYNGENVPEIGIIKVFICKLRKWMSDATDGKNYIETVRGQGYALRDPVIEVELNTGRQDKGPGKYIVTTGALVVNLGAMTVETDGRSILLSELQWVVFGLLNKHKGTIVTRAVFRAHIINSKHPFSEHTITNAINQIRQKIGRGNGIATITGCGYILRDPT